MIRQHGNIKINFLQKKKYRFLLIAFLLIGLLLSGCVLTDEEQEWKLFTAVTSNNLEAVEEVIEASPHLDYENLSYEDSTPFQTFSDNRALALALSCSDTEIAKVLLESGFVTTETEDEYTYLNEAVGNLDVELVEALLVNGADVNAGDEPAINRYMSFVYPKLEDKEKRAELLLQYGAAMDESTIHAMLKNEWRYLYIAELIEYADSAGILYTLPQGVTAAIKGDSNELQRLIRKCDAPLGNDVLFFAAAYCDVETLQALKQCKADFNITDDGNRTLLHIASLCNKSDVVEFLISEGLSVEQTDGIGWTPITYAAIGAKEENLKVLLEHGARYQNGESYSYLDGESREVWTWSAACSYGTVASVRTMINTGYNLSKFDCYMAYVNANDDIFYALQGLGVPIVEEWDGEKTIEHVGEKQTEFLLEQGVKPTSFVYEQAVQWRNKDMLDMLLRQDKTIETINEAVITAIEIGDIECLQLFAEFGVNLNQKIETTEGSTTLLHIAAACPSINIVEFLLTQGADVNAKDESGNSPYSVAKENGFEFNARVLQQ